MTLAHHLITSISFRTQSNPLLRSRISFSHIPSLRALSISSRAQPILEQLDLLPSGNEPLPGLYDGAWKQGHGELLKSYDPATGLPIGPTVSSPDSHQTNRAILTSSQAAPIWRAVPAPKRGEILKEINARLTQKKDALASLITLEMGKIKPESLGEVEEAIQIFDYALGLSRIFGGKLISSERSGHVIQEIPNPLGLVGVISAFNFPCELVASRRHGLCFRFCLVLQSVEEEFFGIFFSRDISNDYSSVVPESS